MTTAFKVIVDSIKKLQAEVESSGVPVDGYDIDATISADGELLSLTDPGVHLRISVYHRDPHSLQPYSAEN